MLSSDNKNVLKAAYSQTPRRMLKNDKVSVFKNRLFLLKSAKYRHISIALVIYSITM